MNLNSTFPDRFWKKVLKTSNCWIWQGAKDKNGYGQIRPNGSTEMVKAHRASFYLRWGIVDNSKLVCHSCDNPSCVNPDHLFLGSPKDNAVDRDTKGRKNSPRGSQLPHTKLTPADVRRIREEYALGSKTYKELGNEYGICPENVGLIVNRKNWKYVV